MKKYIVRYNVEFSMQVEAASEEEAIKEVTERVEEAIELTGDDQHLWDQKATSQYEAEEADDHTDAAG